MTDYMNEAERLISAHEWAIRQHDRGAEWDDAPEKTLAALLAHIQRGAVPDGWQLVPKEPTPEMLAGGWGYWLNVMAPGKQRDTAAKEYTAMLAAAPAPDHFRDAAKMMAVQPSCMTCSGHGMIGGLLPNGGGYESDPCPDCTAPAPAEVPMPEPDMSVWDTEEVRTYSDECIQQYGERCRAAGEAAGYARGLRDAVRDAKRYSFLRGDGGPTSVRWPRWEVSHWTGSWNPVSGKELDTAIDAALRGEVK